jgi:hypothetical protein
MLVNEIEGDEVPRARAMTARLLGEIQTARKHCLTVARIVAIHSVPPKRTPGTRTRTCWLANNLPIVKSNAAYFEVE